MMGDEKPKVTVIVPAFNTQEYLRRCLDSLTEQTLGGIEIIVVNDGSPDNSQEIIDEYALKYPGTLKSFIKENGGLSSARNFGVKKATGEYIGFVDSDDYVDNDFYERMYNKAKDTDSDIVASPITYEFEDHVKKKFFNKRRFGKNVREDGYILLKANSFAWNKIYRTSFWKENEFEFPSQWYEDSALIYNVMLMANRVSCVNIPFYHYIHDRQDSIINSVSEKVFDIFKSTDSIIKFYKEHNAFEELYDTVEHLCVRHIFGRISILRNSQPTELNARFADVAIDYLNRNFKDWRSCEFLQPKEDASRFRRMYCQIVQNEKTLKRYILSKPFPIYDNIPAYRAWRKQIKRNSKKYIKKQEKRRQSSQEKKRNNIQRYGPGMIRDIQVLLNNIGVICFADFGTCLGIVREGGLLKHDLDIDLGVISDRSMQMTIRIAMERAGYRLWRQYIYNGYVAEESYLLRGIKVDLNYYIVNDDCAKTWLFYRKPGIEYKNNTRHIVEMTYSPIKTLKEVSVEGINIKIPENAESLMEEKYGPGWRTPDTGWIYWESPAAEKLDEIGYYITYKYQDIKMRTRETPKPVLIDSQIDGHIDWDKAYKCAEAGFDPIVIGSEEEKGTNRHPRIRFYVGEINDNDFIEKLRRRTCGDESLIKYSDIC